MGAARRFPTFLPFRSDDERDSWLSTIRLQIDSPKPNPSGLVVKNGVAARGWLRSCASDAAISRAMRVSAVKASRAAFALPQEGVNGYVDTA
jgi:hypothetical protein